MLLAIRAMLGGLALTFRLHALIDRLAVLFGQVGAPYAHVDHTDAERAGFAIELFAHARGELRAFVAHHIEEGGLAEHPAQRGDQQGR